MNKKLITLFAFILFSLYSKSQVCCENRILEYRENLGYGGYERLTRDILFYGRQSERFVFCKTEIVNMNLSGRCYRVTLVKNVKRWFVNDCYGRLCENISLWVDYYFNNNFIGRGIGFKDSMEGDYLSVRIEPPI